MFLAGNVKSDARKEMWQGGVKRCFFCTPQTFWNDVKRGAHWQRAFILRLSLITPGASLLAAGSPRLRVVQRASSLLPPNCDAGICPYDKVVCLVVDECHRATGGWVQACGGLLEGKPFFQACHFPPPAVRQPGGGAGVRFMH